MSSCALCTLPSKSRGLCGKHYAQEKRRKRIHLYSPTGSSLVGTPATTTAHRSYTQMLALGRAFSAFRKARGMSFIELHRATGIDRRTLQRFEAGGGSLTIDRLLLLLRVMPNGKDFFPILLEIVDAN